MDPTPPAFMKAEVPSNGQTIVLTYNENLDNSSIPAASDFSITGITIASVSVSGDKVTLNSSTIIGKDEIIKLNYTKPNTNPIQDTEGSDSISLTDENIENNSTADTTPPTVIKAEIPAAGTTIELTFNDNIKSDSTFAVAAGFTITGSPTVTVTDVTADGTTKVVLTLNITIDKDITDTAYKLAYTQVAGKLINDDSDNALVDFSDEAITNKSEQDVDDIPPTVTKVEIPAAGATMIVTFDDNIKAASSFADAAGFIIAGSPTVNVTAVTADGTNNKVVLTLDTTINEDIADTVYKLAYTQDASKLINDDSDNALVTFSDKAITNNSTVDQTSPLVTNIEIPAAGTTIELTLDDIIQSTSFADAAGFSITGTPAVTVTNVTADGTDNKVILTLNITIDKDVTNSALTLAYTQVTGKLINDDSNNALVAFSNEAITNTSTADCIPPSLLSATVPSAGTTIELTYDETLDTSSKPANSDFTIFRQLTISKS